MDFEIVGIADYVNDPRNLKGGGERGEKEPRA